MLSRLLKIGEPQVEQNKRWTPSGVLNDFSESFPLASSNAASSTVAFAANTEPLALRQREQ